MPIYIKLDPVFLPSSCCPCRAVTLPAAGCRCTCHRRFFLDKREWARSSTPAPALRLGWLLRFRSVPGNAHLN